MSGHTEAHSPLPWEKFGMGDIMSKGPDGYRLVKTNYEHAPQSEVAEREANAAFIVTACNSHADLVKALENASIQCGNAIFNCEQRPADNEKHLRSWRAVKEYIDGAIARTALATLTARKVE